MNFKWLYGVLEGAGLARFMAGRIPHNRVTVLSLHRVAQDEDFFWQPMRIWEFEQLLAFCRENFEIITFAELWRAEQGFSKPPLILSFDDGYRDFIEVVLPLLIKHGLPCNHNIVTECVDNNRVIWTQKMNIIFNYLRNKSVTCSLHLNGETIQVEGDKTNWNKLYNRVYHTFLTTRLSRDLILDEWAAQVGVTSFAGYPMMTWEEISHCAEKGVEIGSHTRTHAVLALCTEDELGAELLGSKQRIEQKLDLPCNTIAFPNGNYNERTLEACERAGYKNILIVNDQRYKMQNTPHSTKVIDRINVSGSGFSALALRVVGFNSLVRNAVAYVRR